MKLEFVKNARKKINSNLFEILIMFVLVFFLKIQI
jgi:hypothetical protein